MDFGIIYRLGQIVMDSCLMQIKPQFKIYIEALTKLALLFKYTVITVIFHTR
ncbi:hypothetical protein D3C72_2138460 [compost metagenome]